MIPVVKCQQQKIGIKFLHRMGSKLLCIFCIVLKYQVFVGGAVALLHDNPNFSRATGYTELQLELSLFKITTTKKKTTHKRPAKGTNGKGA